MERHAPTPGDGAGAPRRLSLRIRDPRRVLKRTIPVLLGVLAGAIVGIGAAAAIHMPRVESVADFTPGLITQLFDRHGNVFATYAKERRKLLKEGEVPELLQNALMAAEDSNFLEHGGVDARGVLRAALHNFSEGELEQGGSTLTQQLARQLFLSPEKTWRRKIEEALLSVDLEKRFSKQQILTLYCNLVNVGHGNYGMEAAANYYFNKTVDELTLPEAAMLFGIVQRPSAYSPYRKPETVLRRRNYVLRRMRDDGYVSEEEYQEAVAQPLLVVTRQAKTRLAPYFAEEIRKHLEATYGSGSLLEHGLQVRTTLDAAIQTAAERALRDGLSSLDHRKGWRGPIYHLEAEDLESQELPSWSNLNLAPGVWNEGIVLASDTSSATVKLGSELHRLGTEGIKWTGRRQPRSILKPGDVAWFRLAEPEEADAEPVLMLEQEPELEGAVVVLESATGAVRALVGGWDFQRNQFNRVTQARRQVGSAFKAFVFGAALEAGFTPADTLFDAPVIFSGAENLPSYSPRNYYRQYYGILTLRRALEDSRNVSAVKLMDLVGVDQVIDFAQRSGIRSVLPPYPSLALGAADLSPLELAGGYAAIANQGVFLEPYLIESVKMPGGRVLEEHLLRANKAMEPTTAYLLTRVLEGVIERGTGVSAKHFELDLAGKTGTTDGYTDAWFVGFSPRYTILAWVGHDVKRSIGRNMTGAEAALPIWRSIVASGLEEGWMSKDERFLPPPGVVFVPVEYATGLLAVPGAEEVIDEAFMEGTEPARQYDPKWAGVMALPWFQQRPFYIPKTGERMPEDIDDWSLVFEAWGADEDEG